MKNNNFFNTVYREFIYKSRYSRYIDDKNRRENWDETTSRYFDFFIEFIKEKQSFDLEPYREYLEDAVLSLKVMPSMRGLMTAGKALKRDEIALYNCSALPIDNIRSLDEELYILMCGVGLGFSVEHLDITNIPILPDSFHKSSIVIEFADSRIGWAKGYREYISLLMNGQIPSYDVSKLRAKGAKLKTFGGRSSGPEPLVELLEFTKKTFINAVGRKLNSLELHDLACKVGDVVITGGVRRSALISLSDLSDDRMRTAKSGTWYETHPHRRLANNSAVYEEKPTISQFMKEWIGLYESKSGERGIVSRPALKKVIEHSNTKRKEWFGEDVRTRDPNHKWLLNPCSEIILRPYQLCNLTSVQIRETDTLEDLIEKVKIATILGTLQSCVTNFRYVNKKWQKNCEDERLLGVSLNGIFDNTLTNGKEGKEKLIEALETLRKTAISTNIEWADKLGIPHSTAITCCKPEGTTSALVDTSSGIHPAHSPYYIRYVRNDLKDPLTQFMIDSKIPYEIDAYDPKNMVSFKFPMKSAQNAITRNELTAIEHLELWKLYQIHYTEHKPSVTITVKEDEWLEVGAWVYKNFEWASGIAFLPHSDTIYKQMPFTDCDKEEYEALLEIMPTKIDWDLLTNYEKEDTTVNMQTLACTADGGCLI
jgi:ribonucleoside-triphosphate reductase (thioredoxin)